MDYKNRYVCAYVRVCEVHNIQMHLTDGPHLRTHENRYMRYVIAWIPTEAPAFSLAYVVWSVWWRSPMVFCLTIIKSESVWRERKWTEADGESIHRLTTIPVWFGGAVIPKRNATSWFRFLNIFQLIFHPWNARLWVIFWCDCGDRSWPSIFGLDFDVRGKTLIYGPWVVAFLADFVIICTGTSIASVHFWTGAKPEAKARNYSTKLVCLSSITVNKMHVWLN